MESLKEIVGNNTRAILSHVIAGVLYYKVSTENHTYMFPVDMNDKEDVGTTTFNADEKAITLMRYIRKAISNESLIQVI